MSGRFSRSSFGFMCAKESGECRGKSCRAFDNYGGLFPIKVEDVTVLKTATRRTAEIQVGNGVYYVATLVTSLAAVKPGPLTVTSMDVNLTLQLPTANQRRDVFDPSATFRQYGAAGSLCGGAEATALPLPKWRRPTHFAGAVGVT